MCSVVWRVSESSGEVFVVDSEALTEQLKFAVNTQTIFISMSISTIRFSGSGL